MKISYQNNITNVSNTYEYDNCSKKIFMTFTEEKIKNKMQRKKK